MSVFTRLKVLYRDRLAMWLINLSALFVIATWVLFLFRRVEHSPLTVLHYNIYSGIDVIAMWQWLYIIPGLILFISLVDFVLAILLWTKERSLSYFLLSIMLVANFITFLYIYNIFNYNI